MGLFSNLRKAQATPNHEVTARAVVTPAIFIMHVDGSVDDAEIAQLVNSCSFSPIFAPIPGQRTKALLNEVLGDFAARSPSVVIGEAISTLSPALRETALLFAMRIALADGRLDDNEQAVLVKLSQDMGISQSTTEAMFAVVTMLQRSADA